MDQRTEGSCVCIQFPPEVISGGFGCFLKMGTSFIRGNEVPRFIYRVGKAFTLVVEPGKSFEMNL